MPGRELYIRNTLVNKSYSVPVQNVLVVNNYNEETQPDSETTHIDYVNRDGSNKYTAEALGFSQDRLFFHGKTPAGDLLSLGWDDATRDYTADCELNLLTGLDKREPTENDDAICYSFLKEVKLFPLDRYPSIAYKAHLDYQDIGGYARGTCTVFLKNPSTSHPLIFAMESDVPADAFQTLPYWLVLNEVSYEWGSGTGSSFTGEFRHMLRIGQNHQIKDINVSYYLYNTRGTSNVNTTMEIRNVALPPNIPPENYSPAWDVEDGTLNYPGFPFIDNMGNTDDNGSPTGPPTHANINACTDVTMPIGEVRGKYIASQPAIVELPDDFKKFTQVGTIGARKSLSRDYTDVTAEMEDVGTIYGRFTQLMKSSVVGFTFDFC